MTTERLSLTMNTFEARLRQVRVADGARRPARGLDPPRARPLPDARFDGEGRSRRSATRTDRFTGTLSAGQTLSVENISGDVVASPGSVFSAVVTVTVTAPSQKQAEELLRSCPDRAGPGRRGLVARDAVARDARKPRHAAPPVRAAASSRATSSRFRRVSTWPLQTVNGDVRVKDLDGEVHLESVNGTIEAHGVRQSLEAQTVNGPIEAVAQAVGRDASLSLESVNGAITLTLPSNAQFDLSAETMNGTIASTFPARASRPDDRPGFEDAVDPGPEGEVPADRRDRRTGRDDGRGPRRARRGDRGRARRVDARARGRDRGRRGRAAPDRSGRIRRDPRRRSAPRVQRLRSAREAPRSTSRRSTERCCSWRPGRRSRTRSRSSPSAASSS